MENNTTPYPLTLEKPTLFPFGKHGPKLEEMWDFFSQVKVNTSLFKLINEVSTYAKKKLKDLCVQKQNLQAHLPKKVNLIEHVSFILSNSLPPNLKDPESPLIYVTLGNIKNQKGTP